MQSSSFVEVIGRMNQNYKYSTINRNNLKKVLEDTQINYLTHYLNKKTSDKACF